ncbi:MAG: phage shock protein operon transcriptional activator [Pontibacterium sp.]
MALHDIKPMLGESSLMLDLNDQISRVAVVNKPVLILGERGTGKELVAARLHYLSQRWDQAFVAINCAAITETLLESELFGHEAGAFTGAQKRHIGRFERAEGGSFFLDELGTCGIITQEKLLRVIEYGEYERVGGQQTLHADVRLIAATNQPVHKMAESGEFRADLLDRLAFDVIHVPPLRYRKDDILLLAEHFAVSICVALGRDYFPGFSESAKDALYHYAWPGNVRELRNVVERSVYRATDLDALLETLVIDPFTAPWEADASPFLSPSTHSQTDKAIPESIQPPVSEQRSAGVVFGDVDDNLPLTEAVAGFEQQKIIQALEKESFNQRKAAQRLGLTYHQLRAQLKKHQMLPIKDFLARRHR